METSLIGKALGFGPNECRFESYVSNFIPYDHNSYLINHLNIAISRKLLRMTIRLVPKTLPLIKLLWELGFIRHYYIHRNKHLRITFSILFYKNTTYYNSLKILSTQSKKFFISLKALKLINKLSGDSVFILSTSKGIITHKKAIQEGLGGLLLCSLN